jgi:hypothetical protein
LSELEADPSRFNGHPPRARTHPEPAGSLYQRSRLGRLVIERRAHQFNFGKPFATAQLITAISTLLVEADAHNAREGRNLPAVSSHRRRAAYDPPSGNRRFRFPPEVTAVRWGALGCCGLFPLLTSPILRAHTDWLSGVS